MPTTKSRIFVTVTDEQDELLDELSSLQGRSKASYLVELLEGAQPLLQALLPVLRAHRDTIESQPAAIRDTIARVLTGLDKGLEQIDLLQHLADKIGREEPRSAPSGARAPRGSSPRIVTRGSATADHEPEGGSKQQHQGPRNG